MTRVGALCMLLVITLTATGCAASVTVTWQTQTEIDTIGFNLYRGTSPDGPFDVKVNEQIIAPSADPLTAQQYSYVDRTVVPGVVYYYQLQEVEKSGAINAHGPISVRAARGLSWWQGAALVLLAAAAAGVGVWLGGRRRQATRNR